MVVNKRLRSAHSTTYGNSPITNFLKDQRPAVCSPSHNKIVNPKDASTLKDRRYPNASSRALALRGRACTAFVPFYCAISSRLVSLALMQSSLSGLPSLLAVSTKPILAPWVLLRESLECRRDGHREAWPTRLLLLLLLLL